MNALSHRLLFFKQLDHRLNTHFADLVKQIFFLELLVPGLRQQVAAAEELPANTAAVPFGKEVHQLPGLRVGDILDGPLVVCTPAVPEADDEDAAGHGPADFLFPTHARAETTGHLQGPVVVESAFIPESVQHRLRSVVSAEKFLDGGFRPVLHNSPPAISTAFLFPTARRVRLIDRAAAATLSPDQRIDDGGRAADAGLDRYGVERAVAAAGAAFHAGVPVADAYVGPIHLEDPVRADFQAHPAAGAFFLVKFQGDDIF